MPRHAMLALVMSESFVTVAHQALLSTGLCWQESTRVGLPCPQGIFPTRGSNLRLLQLPHCRWILYHLSQQGSI